MSWLFSSSNIENIEVGYKRFLWGFWDREAGKKQRENWRRFIASYNRIKSFDSAILQTTRGDVHAFGIIKEKFYDDQTPVWPQELEQNRVLFPWRVSFSFMMFSTE